jgi:amidohydrolase family protein
VDRSGRLELLSVSRRHASEFRGPRRADARQACISGGVRLSHDLDEPRGTARIRHYTSHEQSHLRGEGREESQDRRTDGNRDRVREYWAVGGFGDRVAKASALALAGGKYNGIRDTLAAAAHNGITTVIDPQSYLEDLPTYVKLEKIGDMPVRLQVALFHRRGTTQDTLNKFAEAREKYNDDHLRVAAVKLYIDDVIEPHISCRPPLATNRIG